MEVPVDMTTGGGAVPETQSEGGSLQEWMGFATDSAQDFMAKFHETLPFRQQNLQTAIDAFKQKSWQEGFSHLGSVVRGHEAPEADPGAEPPTQEETWNNVKAWGSERLESIKRAWDERFRPALDQSMNDFNTGDYVSGLKNMAIGGFGMTGNVITAGYGVEAKDGIVARFTEWQKQQGSSEMTQSEREALAESIVPAVSGQDQSEYTVDQP